MLPLRNDFFTSSIKNWALFGYVLPQCLIFPGSFQCAKVQKSLLEFKECVQNTYHFSLPLIWWL